MDELTVLDETEAERLAEIRDTADEWRVTYPSGESRTTTIAFFVLMAEKEGAEVTSL